MNGRLLYVASKNPGKVCEIAALAEEAGLDFDVRPLPEGVALPSEGGDYLANARAKARAACAATGEAAVADDSGLEVDALGGAPGPFSARYGADDAARIERLLAELDGKANRRARFRCVAALALPDGTVETAEGIWEGEIAEAPRGAGGFGYDPVFLDPADGRTAAQLTPEEKRARSHRGRAFRALFARTSSSTASPPTSPRATRP